MTNLELRRLLGFGVRRHAVEIQKTLRVAAPPEKVFRLWNDFRSFPTFMKHVRRVRRIEDHRKGKDLWRWTVRGATGLEFDFDSVITAREENRLIAWSTEPGSLIQHAGRVQFHPNADGTTTIDVKMVYNPVVGAIGHAIARLLGTDPKHRMDDDLMRMKTFLETGRLPRDAAASASELMMEEMERHEDHEQGLHAAEPTRH